jgi:hypothetical protein
MAVNVLSWAFQRYYSQVNLICLDGTLMQYHTKGLERAGYPTYKELHIIVSIRVCVCMSVDGRQEFFAPSPNLSQSLSSPTLTITTPTILL